jgi:hypothetical protein
VGGEAPNKSKKGSIVKLLFLLDLHYHRMIIKLSVMILSLSKIRDFLITFLSFSDDEKLMMKAQ